MREEIPMGKVTSINWITKEEDLPQIKGGKFSIVTGRNLRTSSTASSKKPKVVEPAARKAPSSRP